MASTREKQSSLKKRWMDYGVYLVVRLFICLIQSLSLDACRVIASLLATVATSVVPIRKRLLEENLSHAFPELSRDERRLLIHEMWEHLILLVAEVAHAPRRVRETNWWHHVRLVDYDPVLKLLHDNRPIILVTGHFGNFEMAGYILGLLGYPTFSVARTLDNPWLERYLHEFREITGQFLISKNGGYDEILDVLRARGTMAFLADQSAGHKGVRVRFFGRDASAYKAMALLSYEYKAPIVVGYSVRRDKVPLQFDMVSVGIFDPEHPPDGVATPRQITQWFTTKLEEGIRRWPEQYWWLHNRWKTFH
ncbi:MAG: lysophospholipid acyltransferase family protein [Planctomycetia bacterium]|nr:lysophospholipid acyltransferase family protein [Planctomycetia bacterium]